MLASARRAWRLHKVTVKLGGPSPKRWRRLSGKTISKGVEDWAKRLRIRSTSPVQREADATGRFAVFVAGKVGSVIQMRSIGCGRISRADETGSPLLEALKVGELPEPPRRFRLQPPFAQAGLHRLEHAKLEERQSEFPRAADRRMQQLAHLVVGTTALIAHRHRQDTFELRLMQPFARRRDVAERASAEIHGLA